jgi:hypothetical protein
MYPTTEPTRNLFPPQTQINHRSSPVLQVHLFTDLFNSVIRITSYLRAEESKEPLYTYIDSLPSNSTEEKKLWKELVKISGNANDIFEYFAQTFPQVHFYKNKTIDLVEEALSR